MTSYTLFVVPQTMGRHALLYSQFDRTMEIEIVLMNLKTVHSLKLHCSLSRVYLPDLSISVESNGKKFIRLTLKFINGDILLEPILNRIFSSTLNDFEMFPLTSVLVQLNTLNAFVANIQAHRLGQCPAVHDALLFP